MNCKNQLWIRVVVLIAFASLLVILYQFQRENVQTMIELIVTGNVSGLINFIRDFGPYALLVSLLIVIFINSVAVLPNVFILAANGVIFGVVKGTFISWLGEVVGVTISFFLMRYVFRDYAHCMLARYKRMEKIDEFSGKRGFWIMLIARGIPYIPSGLITALGALSSISARDYILATMIGKLPSAFIEVTLGHDLMSFRDHIVRLVSLIAISGAGYYLYIRYNKGKGELK